MMCKCIVQIVIVIVHVFNPYPAGGYFGYYEMMQKTWKITETLAYRYSSESTQWELSNEYHHNRI